MEITGLGGVLALGLVALLVLFGTAYLAAHLADRHSLPEWLVASGIVVVLVGLLATLAVTVEYEPDHRAAGYGNGDAGPKGD